MNKCKRIGFRVQIRLSDIKEKLKGMMERDKMEELPEYVSEDNADGTAGNSSEDEVRTEEKKESSGGEPAEDTANLDETEGEKKVEEFEDQN